MKWPYPLPRCLAGLLLLLGSLLSTPAQSQAIKPKPPARSVEAARPFGGYHRYRGTVGGRPVLLELTVDATDSYYPKRGLRCQGSYFYERRAGGDLQLQAAEPYRAQQPLRLTEGPGGTWQATQPLGPVLTGTWTGPTGRRLPFALREDYQDAVRYELLAHKANGNACPNVEGDMLPAAWAPYAHLTQQFLHLRGADTLRPALRRLQCPPPARRRALTRAAAHHAIDDCTDTDKSIRINLNAYGLLAVEEDEYVNEYNGARPHATSRSRLYDLRAGRWLPLEEILRPEAISLPLLEQLVGRHLLTDYATTVDAPSRQNITWQEGDSTRVALPQTAPAFTSQGLWVSYSPYETNGPADVYISYTELLPLLRPGTPVVRMLRQRGLWPANK
jgi:hypothetical protein